MGENAVYPSNVDPPGGDLAEDPNLSIAEAPAAGELLDLLAVWQAWPKDGRLPRRRAFDPVEFPRLLPWMVLVELEARPNRHRDYDLLFRYIGSAVADTLQSQGLTGTYLSALPDPFPERWFPSFDRLRRDAKPIAVHGKPYLIDKAYLQFELLCLPLARNAPADPNEVGFGLICMDRESVQ